MIRWCASTSSSRKPRSSNLPFRPAESLPPNLKGAHTQRCAIRYAACTRVQYLRNVADRCLCTTRDMCVVLIGSCFLQERRNGCGQELQLASAAGYDSEKSKSLAFPVRTAKEGVGLPQGLAIGTERSSVEEATPAAAVPITTFPLDQEMRRTRLCGNREDLTLLLGLWSQYEERSLPFRSLIGVRSCATWQIVYANASFA